MMTLHAWRRATQALLCITLLAILFNIVVGNWAWDLMLALVWLLCLLSYVWARRKEHDLDEITAYHDWLQWKISQQ